MKKDEKPETLAIMDNYNFCDISTDGHGDSMTDPAQRAESVTKELDLHARLG